MNELREKIEEHANLLVELIKDTMAFGIKFEEAVPAMSYFHYRDEDGESYVMKLELSIQQKR